jgi:hypothetical protein
MHCEFLEKQPRASPRPRRVVRWLEQWFREKAAKRGIKFLCHQVEAMGFFVGPRQVTCQRQVVEAAEPGNIEWLKGYLI